MLSTINEKIVLHKRLGTRVFWAFILQNATAFLFILLLLFLFTFFDISKNLHDYFGIGTTLSENIVNIIFFAGLISLFLTFVWMFIIATIRYYSYSYSLDENAFRVTEGILNKSEVSVPFRQIQDINIEQSLLNQIMGVARFEVLTAGREDFDVENKTGQSSVHLPIIKKTQAEDMRVELIRLANIQRFEINEDEN